MRAADDRGDGISGVAVLAELPDGICVVVWAVRRTGVGRECESGLVVDREEGRMKVFTGDGDGWDGNGAGSGVPAQPIGRSSPARLSQRMIQDLAGRGGGGKKVKKPGSMDAIRIDYEFGDVVVRFKRSGEDRLLWSVVVWKVAGDDAWYMDWDECPRFKPNQVMAMLFRKKFLGSPSDWVKLG